MKDSPEDEKIIAWQRAAKEGDLDAFGLLVSEHQQSIRAFVTSRIDDPFEAQDLAQEVFLVAWRKLGEIDMGRSFHPWLCAIAANLIRNHRRKRRAVPMGGNSEEILNLLNAEVETLSSGWKESPVLGALEDCLGRLKTEGRELVKLRYEDGMGISEIRKSFGGKHSAVTMKLHRLRDQLRRCIDGKLEEQAHR